MPLQKFQNYLAEVRYRDWDFNVRMDGTRCYLQIGFWEQDTQNPAATEKMYQQGRKWLLSPHMTKSEVIQTAFKAVMTAEEHEVRERFSYRDKNIFGPHFHVDALWDLCDKKRIDIRKPLVKEA